MHRRIVHLQPLDGKPTRIRKRMNIYIKYCMIMLQMSYIHILPQKHVMFSSVKSQTCIVIPDPCQNQGKFLDSLYIASYQILVLIATASCKSLCMKNVCVCVCVCVCVYVCVHMHLCIHLTMRLLLLIIQMGVVLVTNHIVNDY